MAERESGSAAFSLGQGARMGNVQVGGHVAGRDVVVGTTPAEAAGAQDMQQVLALLERLEADIEAMQQAPAGLRDDARDEVRKAKEAGTKGDTQRMHEKLGSAQGFLERMSQNLPAALTLAQTVATLAQRVSGLG
jgi:hypothetical protein